MKYAISHRTTYTYGEPVDLANHILHLTPRETPWQRVLEAEVLCDPLPLRRSRRLDHFGNTTIQISIEDPHTSFTITASCQVEVALPYPPSPDSTPAWENVRGQLLGDGFPLSPEASEFTYPSPLIPLLDDARAYALPSFPANQPLLYGLRDLTRRIHRDFRFQPGATAVSTPVQDVLRERRGVCQDFAHVQLACLRALGLSARYVSGYLRTLPPPGQYRLIGADASHAWVSAWCPGFGWIDLDPTNDLVVAEDHVTLAWGRDYADVSPVRGIILGGGSHSLDVAVQMDELS